VHGGDGLGDLRAAQQCVLDLAQLDTVPADLDLVVYPADVLQLPAGAPSSPGRPCGYIREPASANGQATKRLAVNLARRQYPTPTE